MVKAAPGLSVSKSSHQVPIGRNGFLSFGERIRSHGQSDPEKAAIICDANRRSYGELLRRSRAATLPQGKLGKSLKRELRKTHASSVGELPQGEEYTA